MLNRSLSSSQRPLRAAFLTPGLLLGGAERWLVSLIKYTDPSRLIWTGVAVSPWGGADKSLCSELAKLTEIHCKDPQIDPHTNGRQFDATHFHGIHPDWSTAIDAVCRSADVLVTWGSTEQGKWFTNYSVPSVLVSHTTQKEDPPKPIEVVTHLAAVSEAAASHFQDRKRKGYDHCRVAVIYNGAEVSRTLPLRGREWQREQWEIGSDDIAVGYIGRQSQEKNYLATAHAVRELPSKFKAVYYGAIVAIPGKPAEDLVQFSRKLPGRIIIRPPESHVGDILAGLDSFVLASHREAFSLGMIEAWLAGVPVVATPVGSVPELHQRYGKLVIEVPLNPTSAQLARAIQQSVGREGQKVANKARLLAHEQFTCKAMANRWMNYLEDVVRTTPLFRHGRREKRNFINRLHVLRRKRKRNKAHE